jgi:hypothetical protein
MEATRLKLDDLMADVLAGMAQDLPWLLGADIIAYRQEHPIVFATYGVGTALQDIQDRFRTGPTREAATTDGPVLSNDLWHDRRWPGLDLPQACALHPEQARLLPKVSGVVAVPGLQDDSGPVVMTAYLGEASTDSALDTIARYERLVTADVATLSAYSGPDQRTSRVLSALHHRDMVEQAKGVVMATCRTDHTMAWMLLQDACRRSNTTLHALAAELLRQVQSEVDSTDSSASGRAAGELWSALQRIHAAAGD